VQLLLLLLSLIDPGTRWRQSASMTAMSDNKRKKTYTQLHSCVKQA